MADEPSAVWLAGQVEKFIAERPRYETYARALDRVLRVACAPSVPEAVVQARAKTVSSFAEKAVRKHGKYKDPARDLTDLCGGRVIVQTLEQVKAVRRFVEHNFEVRESDDKTLSLSEDRFGYRDMHYLVRLKADRAPLIGFTPKECATIGERVAELQVRSLVQHAWADILHDRMYKAPLRRSAEAKRTVALLAALMEEGDRNFDGLAIALDGMVANYTAYANPAEVTAELAVQKLIHDNEPDPEKRARIALVRARLLGPCGKYADIVEILGPFAGLQGPSRSEILLELGHALCRVHRAAPTSDAFRRGQAQLQEVIERCDADDLTVVPNPRKSESRRARAHSRLAWSWEAVPHGEGKARDGYRKAFDAEPENPYHLADQLGFEFFTQSGHAMVSSMTPVLRRAVATCREHALAGIELPHAMFAAGRLSLLLREDKRALGWYARGLRCLLDERSCVPATALDDELEWVRRIHRGADSAPEEHRWVERLLELGKTMRPAAKATGDRADAGPVATSGRYLVVTGGAASMTAEMLAKIRPTLASALAAFEGTVISGGTTSGIPGCVGEITEELHAAKRKHFDLVGYVPRQLPVDATKDPRYRLDVVREDAEFSPGQTLRMWEDLAKAGVTSDRVAVIGFGGGTLTLVDYQIALALGAGVAPVRGSGGMSDGIVDDPVWADVSALTGLPLDPASAQAFVAAPVRSLAAETYEQMAQALHSQYVSESSNKLPANMRPWPKLGPTFKTASLEQARYLVEVLRAGGFDVRAATGGTDAIANFKADEFKADVERMSELEHGRWNVERLRDGWRYGATRDDAGKIHNCLVSWQALPDAVREYDRSSIRIAPEILARAGLEVFRR